jgi:hypothetical protein
MPRPPRIHVEGGFYHAKYRNPTPERQIEELTKSRSRRLLQNFRHRMSSMNQKSPKIPRSPKSCDLMTKGQ